jgi:hypothetical protein
MLSIDRRDVFKARISGKNLDLGLLSPDPANFAAVVNTMVEIGMLVPQEILEGVYKVNVNFQYDTVGKNQEVIELDYEFGQTVGLCDSGVFMFVDKRGDLFVAEMNKQAEEQAAEEEESETPDTDDIDWAAAFADGDK